MLLVFLKAGGHVSEDLHRGGGSGSFCTSPSLSLAAYEDHGCVLLLLLS